ncbi:2-oxo-3-hexenedioate decarboxylase [Alcanivorax sp. N3-2A]|nr:2-oxo-3-hexenedioate decarboxylase [Alcanivorax sp. N3-2A]|tara:strand:+ start:7428 stop:8219 length:792 start_codon:yes stop_codon:yes gene_type:complete
MRTLTEEQMLALAERVENAELNRTAIAKVTVDYPDMTFADAYDVQWEIQRRKRERGHRLAGMKMGLTSRAKMAQMGVETPIYGFLADYFAIPEGGEIRCDELIHPKIEAELAFVTKAPLRGPGCHIGDVLAATDFVIPAVEVIDSRYQNFDFDLVSVVADNASSSRFVTGGRSADVAGLDLTTLGVVVEKNGEVVEVGAGAAVLGHPAASVAMLANLLAERDQYLPAGSFVMTGGITAAIAVQPGDAIHVRYQGLGSISMRIA